MIPRMKVVNQKMKKIKVLRRTKLVRTNLRNRKNPTIQIQHQY